jgi:hypothetical protein
MLPSLNNDARNVLNDQSNHQVTAELSDITPTITGLIQNQ